jgi:hypothetical protein
VAVPRHATDCAQRRRRLAQLAVRPAHVAAVVSGALEAGQGWDRPCTCLLSFE